MPANKTTNKTRNSSSKRATSMDTTVQQVAENEEVQALMKILGLEQGRTYDSLSNLEYGSLLIMTDQDLDGNHITGLIINFLGCLFPSFSNNGKLAMTMENDGLLSTMRDLEIAPLMKPKNTSTTWIDMLKIQADKRKTWILYQLLG
nr:12929_t:CDS:2 [Entrophospora candida]